MAKIHPDGSRQTDLTDGEKPERLAFFSDCPMHGHSMLSYIFTMEVGAGTARIIADIYKCCVEGCELFQAEVRN